MLTIETVKAIINKPSQLVYDFVSNSENLGKILPEQVECFKGDTEMCVFEVKGLAKIGLQIEERCPIEFVLFKNTDKTPVKFTLKVNIEKTSDTTCAAQMIFNGDVNPMMKMMLEKPLNNLFTSMAKKLEEVMNA
jgi:hypothetical protein